MKRILAIVLALMLFAGLAGAAEAPKAGGTLRVGVNQLTTNVGFTPGMSANAVMKFIRTAYNSFISYDEMGNIVPDLATEWSQDAASRTITFKLRDDVVFYDGTPFNAEAAKWNIQQYIDFGRTEVGGIASMECPDDYTLTITLEEWNASRLQSIGFYVCFMSPAAIEKNGVDWAYANTCGTGPFVLSEAIEGSKFTYTKNENYWGTPALVDVIEYHNFTDATTVSYALKVGEIDAFIDAAATIILEFRETPGFSIQENTNGQGAQITGLIPNSAEEFRADGSPNPWYLADVRKALCYAIDNDTLAEIMSYGLYKPTNQWAIDGSVTYSPNVITYDYNPEKARELLAQAGYADGFTTNIYNSPGGFDDACALIQAYLADVGVTLNIVADDPTTMTARMYNGWEGLFWHWATITPDLGLYMGRHLDVDGAYYAGSIQHPQDAMELLYAIRVAASDEEVQQLSWKLQEVLYNDYALFGSILYANANTSVVADYVKDGAFSKPHAALFDPLNVWLDK